MMEAQENNPYVGPRAFQLGEAELFFGREREARDLVSLVAAEQLVLFYAQSGAGKSSLINARLIPGLEEKGFNVLPVGRVSGTPLGNCEPDNIFVSNLMLSLFNAGVAGGDGGRGFSYGLRRARLDLIVSGRQYSRWFAHAYAGVDE